MVRISIKDYDKIQKLVEDGEYSTVTDFIRAAIRELLRRHEK
jgi:Arc/MetJ-type ribon-helix-helix transcriptional regulator